MPRFALRPGALTLADLRGLLAGGVTIAVPEEFWPAIDASARTVAAWSRRTSPSTASTPASGCWRANGSSLATLPSCSAGWCVRTPSAPGSCSADESVRLVLALKVNALARGYSGVRRQVIETLMALYNADLLPAVPAKGSVGASGDLAPLAHLSLALIGEGEIRVAGTLTGADAALKQAKLAPLTLEAKEGLALLNGTQVSTALAAQGLFAIENVFAAALVSGALSLDAAKGSDVPFDPRIQAVRGHPGQAARGGGAQEPGWRAAPSASRTAPATTASRTRTRCAASRR